MTFASLSFFFIATSTTSLSLSLSSKASLRHQKTPTCRLPTIKRGNWVVPLCTHHHKPVDESIAAMAEEALQMSPYVSASILPRMYSNNLASEKISLSYMATAMVMQQKAIAELSKHLKDMAAQAQCNTDPATSNAISAVVQSALSRKTICEFRSRRI